MKINRKTLGIIIVILFAAGALKFWLVTTNRVPFNADEAIVALMARHILSGERPTFFYGQVYMGSLDAFLVAGGFLLFGQQVWVIRFIQGILYLGTIITTILIGVKGFGSWKTGFLAGCLLAIPTVNVTLYTTASLGGYGEALLLGNLILLTGIKMVSRISRVERGEIRFSLFLGFLIGLGFWANAITLIYSIPVVLVILTTLYLRKVTIGIKEWALKGGLFVIGFMLGSSPWWIFALNHGWDTLLGEILGSAVSVEPGGFIARILTHLVNLGLLGLTVLYGLRPPWEVRWLAVPLQPFIIAFWLGASILLVRNMFRKNPFRFTFWMLGGVGIFLTGGFLFTSFGVDPSGRYFLPLMIPLALAAAELVQIICRKTYWQVSAIGLVVLFNLWATIQCALFPTGLTTQFYSPSIIDHSYDSELLTFLEKEGETYGYSNYWVSYPLAFLSKEQVIFIPRLPYHTDLRYTDRDNRYHPYDQLLAKSARVAYITTHNPSLDLWIRENFALTGVSWSEKTIGDYQIFYHLSKPVRPEQIGL